MHRIVSPILCLCLICFSSFIFGLGCGSPVFDTVEATGGFNSPIGLAIVEQDSRPYALVVNSNFDLTKTFATLSVVDLSSDALVADTLLEIPNLGGKIAYRADKHELYLSQKNDDALDILTLSPSGTPSVFGIEQKRRIAFERKSNPYDFVLLDSPNGSLLAIVTNTLTAKLAFANLGGKGSRIDEIDIDSAEVAIFRSSRGIGLDKVVVTPDKKFALCSSTNSNIVFVIDIAALEIEGYIYIDSIGGGATAGIRGMAVSKNRNHVYVSSTSQNALVAIDLSTITDNGISLERIQGAVIGSTALDGKDPSTVGISPDEQYAYVLNYQSATISVVAIDARKHIATIPSGNGPAEIAFYTPYKRGYVTNFLSDSLTVFDYETNKLVTTIKNPDASQ